MSNSTSASPRIRKPLTTINQDSASFLCAQFAVMRYVVLSEPEADKLQTVETEAVALFADEDAARIFAGQVPGRVARLMY